MRQLRVDSSHDDSNDASAVAERVCDGFEVSWEEDARYRMSPQVLTSLLREQVPVLEFVDWHVTSITPGQTTSVLPLNPPSTNQHFTHQAANIVLAADYTGGAALASLLPGWPIVGVHPVTTSNSLSLWLLKVDIKYLRPSVGDLVIRAVVPDDKRRRIRRRFLAGRPVIETITVEFDCEDKTIAKADLTYFARQTDQLRSDGQVVDKVNTLYELKLTSSAELIAGVRARESGSLFEDPYAEHMAGQHGMALATRFQQRTPQLGRMVAARTAHLDRQMLDFVEAGGREIVLLGAGWDMRPFRLAFPEGTRFYEVDFSTTLLERCRRLDDLGLRTPPGISRVNLPIDLRTMSLDSVLYDRLSPDQPVFIAWEGMSMYFDDDEIGQVLEGIRAVMKHPDSKLWVDLVDREAVLYPERYPQAVYDFMYGMQILGEPFTFGVDSVEDFMTENRFQCEEIVGSDAVLETPGEPVYRIYKFCVAKSATAVRSLRADPGSTGVPASASANRHSPLFPQQQKT